MFNSCRPHQFRGFRRKLQLVDRKCAVLSHYVLIRRDLPAGIQLAYVVHAAGESTQNRVPTGTRAVVLSVADEGALQVYAQALERAGVEHMTIVEDGQAYAIGVTPAEDTASIRRLTSALPLAG